MKLKVTNGSYSLMTNTKMKICGSKIILYVDNNEISCLEDAEQKGSDFSYEAILYDGRLKVNTEFQVTDKLLVTLKIENFSDEPITINRCYCMRSEIDTGCDIHDVNILCH